MKRTLLVLLVVLLWGSTALFQVDQTEFAVQMRFGQAVRTLTEPGLYAKLPWPVETLVRFDNRLRVLQNPGPGETDREYLTRDEQSGIGKNVVATTYTGWRIKRDEAAVLRFLQTMGDVNSAEARLSDVVVSEVGAALGQADFSVLVSTDDGSRDWPGFLERLRARCAERVLEPYGIEIVDVRIQRLNFPTQNRRNVFDRMRAERETIAARYRSEGEERATSIKAEASRKREEILAEAREEAARIRGQAEGEAGRIYAEAYGKDPEFYAFMRTLEAWPKTLGEGTTAILSGDSDFLRLLNQRPEPPPVDPPKGAGDGE